MNNAAIHAVEIAAIVVGGTMTGNEIGVAVFFHPRVSRLPDKVHVEAVRTLAVALGAAMPFWYALSFLLSLGHNLCGASDMEHTTVAGSWFERPFWIYDCLLPAAAGPHQ